MSYFTHRTGYSCFSHLSCGKQVVTETWDQTVKNLVTKSWLRKIGKGRKEGKQEPKRSFKGTMNHIVEWFTVRRGWLKKNSRKKNWESQKWVSCWVTDTETGVGITSGCMKPHRRRFRGLKGSPPWKATQSALCCNTTYAGKAALFQLSFMARLVGSKPHLSRAPVSTRSTAYTWKVMLWPQAVPYSKSEVYVAHVRHPAKRVTWSSQISSSSH